ncbi:MAG: hypothetical protein ISR48_11580 [Alphaproteobacteria bacterium]|nr:hypothetical protein [Alphaproteobacteria bacterium]
MPKTDITKIESDDIKELSDEALDRAAGSAQLCPGWLTDKCGAPTD